MARHFLPVLQPEPSMLRFTTGLINGSRRPVRATPLFSGASDFLSSLASAVCAGAAGAAGFAAAAAFLAALFLAGFFLSIGEGAAVICTFGAALAFGAVLEAGFELTA